MNTALQPLPGAPLLGVFALLLGLIGGVGLWSVVSLPRSARASQGQGAGILVRIAHSLRDVSGEARAELQPRLGDPLSIGGIVVSPFWRALSARFHAIAGGHHHDLLSRTGLGLSLEEYQLARLVSGMLGAAVAGACGIAVMTGRPDSSWLVPPALALVGVAVGAGVFDRRVRALATARQERISEEFPTVLELLSLALTAGDSLPGALRRIAARGTGELAREWARVIRLVDLGEPLGKSLLESARTLGVDEVEALVDHLVQALERGAPLADVVFAHSSDSRLQRLRGIVDRAGKAEVAMLVPLVLLILPITVIFAVWPSLQAIHLTF